MSQVNVALRTLRVISVVIFLMALQVSAFATNPSGPKGNVLDGLKFEGQTGEKDKGDHHSDTITFEDGKFRSLDCEDWGFSPAPYSVLKDGDKYIFSAVLRSANRGTLEWRGVITGDTATATFHWQHERWYWDIDRHYWFEGTRRE